MLTFSILTYLKKEGKNLTYDNANKLYQFSKTAKKFPFSQMGGIYIAGIWFI